MNFIAQVLSIAAGVLLVAAAGAFIKGEITKGVVALLVSIVLVLLALVIYLLKDER